MTSNEISPQECLQAVLRLRNAEHDLVKLADLAVLARLPMEGETTVRDWIGTALVNVRGALALIGGGSRP